MNGKKIIRRETRRHTHTHRFWQSLHACMPQNTATKQKERKNERNQSHSRQQQQRQQQQQTTNEAVCKADNTLTFTRNALYFDVCLPYTHLQTHTHQRFAFRSAVYGLLRLFILMLLFLSIVSIYARARSLLLFIVIVFTQFAIILLLLMKQWLLTLSTCVEIRPFVHSFVGKLCVCY